MRKYHYQVHDEIRLNRQKNFNNRTVYLEKELEAYYVEHRQTNNDEIPDYYTLHRALIKKSMFSPILINFFLQTLYFEAQENRHPKWKTQGVYLIPK